jgi:hypothetical protein
MAANALANIAAATAAGYVLERYTLPSGASVTKLSRKTGGVEGKEGQFVQFAGESAVSSAAADTAALTNLNRWRDNRYGPDSAQASLSPTPTAATSPTTQGVTPTHRALTKDKD